MNEYGRALQYASDELRADRKVVLAAVMKDCLAIDFAEEELQRDQLMLTFAAADGRRSIKIGKLRPITS